MSQENNPENSITITIVSNGISGSLGAIQSAISDLHVTNPSLATGALLAKFTVFSAAADSLSVAIALQSGDGERIGSASAKAAGSLILSTVAVMGIELLGFGAVVSFAGPIFLGATGSIIGGMIWDTYKDGIHHTNPNPPTNPPLLPLGDANDNGIPDIHESTIPQNVATDFTTSQRWVPPRRDPLTFDLDNDGLETVGIDSNNPILFDHDGDGIKSGTGWIKSDDAFLVLDKNGNGTIDNGRELFGDSTIKSNGQLAIDGFDALVDLDSNADGMVNASDAQFANLKLWRDLNQDGISQTGELFTLNDLGIASINVAKQFNSQVLPDGNRIADLGTYTRVDGTLGGLGETSKLGDIDLAEDTFHRTFSDALDITAVINLPDMQGSGQVRDLREAANDREWRELA